MQSTRPGPAGFLVLVLLVGTVAFAASAPAAGAETCSFPVTAVDATGTSVTVDGEPAEVVTLAPSAAQTMWEIGAKEKVIGVSHNADYLDGSSSRTTISSFSGGIDAETVVNLDPDLVLAPNIVEDATVEQLRSTGLTVYKFGAAESIEDVYAKTIRTGRLVGACDGAEGTVADMKAKIGTAREAVEGKQRPRVFYHMGSGWTAGSDTFIHEIITTAGGENVAATAGIDSYRVMSSEVLVSSDPEWFVRGSVPVPDSSPYADTTAGERGRIVAVNADYLNQPAPRIVRPIETIAEALHPGVDLDLSEESGVEADLTGANADYSSSVTHDGALSLSVSGLYSSRSANFTVPEDGDVSSRDGVDLRSIDLTLREPNPSFLLTVSDGTAGRDESVPATESGRLLRFSVAGNGLLAEEVERTGLRFHVQRSTLDDRGIDPDRVTLYHRESGEWRALETRVVEYGNGTLGVTANASSVGDFALAGQVGAGRTPASGDGAAGSSASDGATDTPAPTPASTESPARATGGTTQVRTATSESPGQPGFGFVLAGLAVVGVAGLRRWRGWP